MFAGVVAILIGGFALTVWWFAMFSGGYYGKAAREMLSGAFSLGRNTISVIEPAVGCLMLLGGCGLIVDNLGLEDTGVWWFFVFSIMACMVIAVLGLIPVRLPGPMYPEWHEERRWRRAEQADWEARYGSRDDGEK